MEEKNIFLHKVIETIRESGATITKSIDKVTEFCLPTEQYFYLSNKVGLPNYIQIVFHPDMNVTRLSQINGVSSEGERCSSNMIRFPKKICQANKPNHYGNSIHISSIDVLPNVLSALVPSVLKCTDSTHVLRPITTPGHLNSIQAKNWQDATMNAITSLTLDTRHTIFSRQELIDTRLNQIIEAVGTTGNTPKQTLSRVLQELRNAGFLEFLGQGQYRVVSSTYKPACADLPEETIIPSRIPTTVSRILRDTQLVASLKRLYAFKCQLCNTRLELSSGFYCEAHHIRPLGIPHNGPDTQSNLIIVCPNHHVLLDYGAISLRAGSFMASLHNIDDEYLHYHNTHIFKG